MPGAEGKGCGSGIVGDGDARLNVDLELLPIDLPQIAFLVKHAPTGHFFVCLMLSFKLLKLTPDSLDLVLEQNLTSYILFLFLILQSDFLREQVFLSEANFTFI